MKNSTRIGLIVLMAFLVALSFSVSFAEDDCTDIRACVENCSEIQNCTEYLNCIDNCTINATAFGAAKGYCAGTGCLGLSSSGPIIPRPIPEISPHPQSVPEPGPEH